MVNKKEYAQIKSELDEMGVNIKNLFTCADVYRKLKLKKHKGRDPWELFFEYSVEKVEKYDKLRQMLIKEMQVVPMDAYDKKS